MRARSSVGVVIALALAIAAGDASAQGPYRAWAPADPLSAPPIRDSVADVALGPAGEALVVWQESGAPGTTYPTIKAAIKQPGQPPTIQTLDFDGWVPKVATDGEGGAIAVWTSWYDTIRASIRPPGGSFGPKFDLVGPDPYFDWGPSYPQVAMNRRGDAVIAFSHNKKEPLLGQLNVIRRPAGGSFSAQEPIMEVASGFGGFPDRATEIAENGEFGVAWSHGRLGGDPDTVRVVTGRVDAGAGEAQVFGNEDREARQPDLEFDRAGRALLIWEQRTRDQGSDDEGSYTVPAEGDVLMARRESGGSFGDPAPVPHSDGASSYSNVGLDGDGNVTFAFSRSEAHYVGQPVIVTGPFAGPYDSALLPAGSDKGDDLQLAVADSGAAMVLFRSHESDELMFEAVRRPPGGSFQPPEDLNVACDPTWPHALAVDSAGRSAAPIYNYRLDALELTVDAESTTPPPRRCTGSTSQPRPFGSEPPRRPADPPFVFQPSMLPVPSAFTLAPSLNFGWTNPSPLLRGRVSAVMVACDKPCRARLSAKLEVRGRRTAIGRTRGTVTPGRPLRLRLRLSRRQRLAALAAVRRGRAVRLRVAATAHDDEGRRRVGRIRLTVRRAR